MICRDGSVGVADQTAPTKAYKPHLEMLFVVVCVKKLDEGATVKCYLYHQQGHMSNECKVKKVGEMK